MSESAERTHAATPHRRRQMLQQGHTARSHELVSASMTLAGLAALALLGAGLVGSLLAMLRDQLGGKAWLTVDAGLVSSHMLGLMLSMAGTLLPLFAVVMATSVLVHLIQAKFVLLPERAWIDPQRLHPGQGWARMLSLDGAMAALLGLVKLASIGGLAIWCILDEQGRLTTAATGDLQQLSTALAHVVLGATVKIGGLSLLLAGLDYGYRWWRHERSMRMTAEEIRSEQKAMQGDSRFSARRRGLQQSATAGVRPVGEQEA